MTTSTKRIEYIDLAKGFCIILVVLEHTFGELLKVNASISIFRMPLYFILSGLFFKPYNLKLFIKKKTNKLLIPFICTFLFIILPLNLILNWIIGHETIHLFLKGGKIFLGAIPAAWFLLCLFFINIYFYCIYTVCKHNIIAITILGCLGGIIGYCLDYYNSYLPMWMDTSLTALPFFIIGYYIKQYSNILYDKFSNKHIITLVFSLLTLSLILYTNKSQSKDIALYTENIYDVNIISLYIGGFTGSLCVLLISKYFTHIPIISYLGRYSIVILLTHQLYIFIIRNILYQLNIPQESMTLNFCIFIIIIILSLPTIRFCIKHLPYMYAQKDLWK